MNSFIKNNSLLLGSVKSGMYFLPNENEWVKAGFYDASLSSYWFYATKSNSLPIAITASSTGDGGAGSTGNFANFANGAVWNGLTGNVTTFATNGGPSYYNTFDQSGLVSEWTEGISSISRVARGGNYSSLNSAINIGSKVVLSPTNKNSTTGFRIATIKNHLNLTNFTNIANINNSNHSTGFGSVSYIYKISQYVVTNSNYVEFLNSVASGPYPDTYALYSSLMSSYAAGGINRSGSSGSYYYTVKTNFANKPVNYISWFNAARYCNWLTNGKPSGSQSLSTTEDGAYYLNGINSGVSINRKSL